ncbi:MAG TPA: ATP-binding protein, partial [Actinomycetota bacterium]|nr:ATP-binding protein [Actinomycetota bacterium]
MTSEKPGHVDFLSRQPDGSYVHDPSRTARFPAVPYWSVYPEPGTGAIWFATPHYVLCLDASAPPRPPVAFPSLIRSVVASGGSLLYGGAPLAPEAPGPELRYSSNSVRFEYAAASFDDETRNEFQTYLEGFEKGWSAWSTETRKDYTNLAEGRYRFHLQARNVHGHPSSPVAYAFRVLPPWYRASWAYASYLLLFLGLLVAVRRYELRRMEVKHQRQLERVELGKLRELDELKSRFFANISHEFRTPLSLILGPVGQMIAEAPEEKTKERLDLVRRNARRLLQLIDQLLDLSRLESGKMQLHATPGDIVGFVRSITTFFTGVAEQKGITLGLEAAVDRLDIDFDKDKVEKVVTNLLANAVKFTPEGGRVAVALGVVTGWAEIRVSDTGIGIPADRLPFVFDRFYQVDGSPTREHEGVGIGLALVKELVALHHGRVDVSSQEGRGTTFAIRFPTDRDAYDSEEIVAVSDTSEAGLDASGVLVEEVAPKESPAASPSGTAPSDEEPIVLLVEDNEELRAYVRRFLEPAYRVLEARDGAEALDLSREVIPDLVISDVMMPRLSGYELCRALKTDERTSHVPVILLTAKAGPEHKLEGLEIGADDYVTKPFDAQELAARVKNLIETRRKLRQRFRGAVVLRPSEMAVSSVDKVFLKKLLSAVEQHIGEEDFSVEALGREVGM